MGGVTRYQYDPDHNLIAETDPDWNTTQWAYNAQDQVTEEISPMGYATTTTYNSDSQIATVTDPDGREAVYSYDEVQTEELKGTGVTNPLSVSMSYNAAGELTEIDRYDSGNLTSEVSHTTFGYDPVGNMTGESDYYGGSSTITDVNAFDAADRITSVTCSDLTSATYYTYNPDSEITSVTGAVNDSYGYDANGNRDTSGYSLTSAKDNQIQTDGTWTYTYDAAGNVTEMSQGPSATTMFFSYNFDNQVTSIEICSTASTATVEQTITYGYDVFRSCKTIAV
jgi:YD repeat-containing protein